MGMAASQARLLQLTARRTNIEYEGQQINQQRTTLSNQSAEYYNQMLALNVPTPPSTDQFTKVNYAFQLPSSNTAAKIGQITKVAGEGDLYSIAYSYAEDVWQAIPCATSDRYKVVQSGGLYSVTDGSGKKHTENTSSPQPISSDLTLCSNLDAEFKNIVKDMVVELVGENSGTPNYEHVYVTNTGSEASPVYTYIKKEDLEKSLDPEAGDERVTWYQYGTVEEYKTGVYTPCEIVRDANNRITNFIYFSEGGDELNIAVETTTVTDADAYNDAYNQYVYETYIYEQTMNEINAKTELIHTQDKTLELRLTQLNTEHNAVQTEMDAVKKVLEKNTEDSFKTFA